VNDEDKAWVRTLPLLAVGGVAILVGGFVFWQKGDSTASIAAMTLGVMFLSMWATTEIVEWWVGLRRKGKDDGES
jgi:predicted membrane protein